MIGALNRKLTRNGLYLEDCKHTPDCLQKFFETIPEFFTFSHHQPLRSDEARQVIFRGPEGMSLEDKRIALITTQGRSIGFFELILGYPNAIALGKETEEVLKRMGDRDALRANLSYLVLHPNERNHGFGSALLSAIEEVLKGDGYGYLHLVVDARNEAAMRWYGRLGYQVLKERVEESKEERRRFVDLILMKSL